MATMEVGSHQTQAQDEQRFYVVTWDKHDNHSRVDDHVPRSHINQAIRDVTYKLLRGDLVSFQIGIHEESL